MKNGKFIGLIVLFVFMLSISTGSAADDKEFKFGEILAMTGSGSWYGMTMERGTSIAVEEINAGGGVNGYRFGYVVEDHKSGLTTPAQNAFRKMTTGGGPSSHSLFGAYSLLGTVSRELYLRFRELQAL